ncbi:MAG: transposase, partial [Synergistaceae bacterium]|nr:transposase [Synergistaceae bacterium]
NGYCESFNARMRDEFLNGEIFDTLREAEVLARDRPSFCVNLEAVVE